MRRTNWTILALIGGLILLLLMIAYFTTNRNPDQDKLSDSQLSSTAAASTPSEKSCASKATYDLIKRELFRRAAQLRGSDVAAYDKLSAFAVVRMENPVMESNDEASRAVNCSGSLSLDLPPGVAAVGGRRTLMSDVDYSVRPAADGSGNVVLLRNADAIIAPLATLGRTGQTMQPPAATVAEQQSQGQTAGDSGVIAAPAAPTAAPAPQAPSPASPPPAQQSTSARPSFDCARARTRGELAVCADSGLASLDRQMAGQFTRAMGQADATQRALLQRTRTGFLAYRDSCRSNACIGDAYRGRMHEIADIMAGRWRP